MMIRGFASTAWHFKMGQAMHLAWWCTGSADMPRTSNPTAAPLCLAKSESLCSSAEACSSCPCWSAFEYVMCGQSS